MNEPGLTYDTGALIAAERNNRLMWALHRAALTRGITPTVPAGSLGEVWRGSQQHHLSRMLKGCRIEDFTKTQAKQVGVMIGQSGLNDIVDVAVVEGALRRNDAVVTSNRSHIAQVANAMNRHIEIYDA